MNCSIENSCRGKVGFPTLLDAQIAKKKRKLKFAGTYRCRHCRQWHIGHTATGKAMKLQSLIDTCCGRGVPV